MELLTATGKTKRVNQFKFSKSINIHLEDTHLLMRPLFLAQLNQTTQLISKVVMQPIM